MAVTPPTTRAVPRSGCLTISSMKTTGMMAARSSVCAPVADRVETRGEEPGEEEDDDGLGDFRGLEGKEASEADPAMRVVRVAKEEERATSRMVVTESAG